MSFPWLQFPVLVLVSSIGFFSGGCYYDIEEELYPDTGCNTDSVTYSGVIAPLLETHCFSCHSTAILQGGISLEGYDQVMVRVTSGQLLGALKREAGFSPMPQNQPKLPDCQIEKIEVWIQEGALNN